MAKVAYFYLVKAKAPFNSLCLTNHKSHFARGGDETTTKSYIVFTYNKYNLAALVLPYM